MPNHWRRFSEDGGPLADFSRDVPDREWTNGFLALEEDYRNTRDGPFEKRMEIELRSLDRRFVAWLAERERGQRLDDLPEGLARHMAKAFRRKPVTGSGADLGDDPSDTDPAEPSGGSDTDREATMEIPEVAGAGQADSEEGPLSKKDAADARGYFDKVIRKRLSGEHLGLLEERSAVDDHDTKRWYVADHHARFQLDVLEYTEKKVARKQVRTANVIRRTLLERLSRTEGYGLETLALAALTYLFDSDDVDIQQGVWRRKPDTAEIDVLAVDEAPPGTLWLGSCKRNPERQDPKKDWKNFMNLTKSVDGLKAEESPSVFLDLPDRRFLFISPEFSEDTRVDLADKALEMQSETGETLGWFTMDISDMLEGRGPRPLPLPEPKRDMKRTRRESPDFEAEEPDDGMPAPWATSEFVREAINVEPAMPGGF